jgi:hypothetical protein
MTTLPKWTDERTAKLVELAGDNTAQVTRDRVATIAESLETSPRSVSAKLRKLNYTVETAAAAPKAFSEEDAADLREFLEENNGTYTYGQIADNFGEGRFTAKQIQGKVLSMELTDAVAPTPKAESKKTYTDEEEAKIVELIGSGAFVEDIAAQLGRETTSIRGKALSLLRAGTISAMPKQRDVKGTAPDALEALGDISGKTVAELAVALDKTERGVKTMLTRRGIKVADHDGAAKREKANAAAA